MCLIDCPPSLGLLTLNALIAADTLLVPLQCEFFALEGLSQLLQTVEQVQQRFNPELGIVGVALTMYDRRNRLTDQVADDVRACLGRSCSKPVIPRNVRLSEAPSHGLPALIYDHRCAGSRAYMALARELIGRLPRTQWPHERRAPSRPKPARARPRALARCSAKRGARSRSPRRRPRSRGVRTLPVAVASSRIRASRAAISTKRRSTSSPRDRGARGDPADRRAPAWPGLPDRRRRAPLARGAARPLHEVPVIVRDFDDAETLEVALVENIQREDLNAIEEAEAYHRLIADSATPRTSWGKLVHKSAQPRRQSLRGCSICREAAGASSTASCRWAMRAR